MSGKRTFVNCRLCLIEIHDYDVTLLDGIIKDMLEIILPELNLTACETPSICKSCLETLKQSYSFKSSCLEVEDKVQDFVIPKSSALIDLKEVLRRSNDLKQISGNHVVCRTCLGLGDQSLHTKLCSYEDDPLQNMVEKCLPEMGLELTKDPSICPMCMEQLEEQFHFIMQCLDTEAKITYYSERKHIFHNIDLHNVYLFSICMEEGDDIEKQYGTGDGMENRNCDRISSLQLEGSFTKNNFHTEPGHIIKKENSDTDFVDLTDNLFPGHVKNKIEKLYNSMSEEKSDPNLNKHLFTRSPKREVEPTEGATFQVTKDTRGEDIVTSEASRISQGDSDSDSDASVTKESDLLAIRKVTSARFGLRKGHPQEDNQPKTKPKFTYRDDEDEKSEEEYNRKRYRTRKCKICDFKTKFSSRMRAHMTVKHNAKVVVDEEHPKPEEKHFKCRHCPFKTLDQGDYKDHKLQHKKDRQQKCPHCSMVFVRPDFLKKHIAAHSAVAPKVLVLPSVSEVPESAVMKRATVTKRPRLEKPPPPPSFIMSRPKNMRNMFNINGQILKMFKCRLCPYQTRLKSCYDKHAQKHKATSEIKTHKCKICNFETIQKENFLTHMQTHESNEGNKVMRCFLCSFQPATELALKQHVNQVHKSGTG